ncbi:MAG: hypothetical protein U0K68_09365 [Agathobacter sp.]|nr:hypothetical protein [Agathobacter sp.]
MSIKKNQIYEQMVFNDYAYAQKEVEKYEEKMIFKYIGLGCGALSTLLGILAFTTNELFATFSIILAIVSYILVGGFLTALRIAKNLAFWGWLIIPFPFDIGTGLMTLIFAILGFLMFPIIFNLIAFFGIRKDYVAAKEYLSFYQPVETNAMN